MCGRPPSNAAAIAILVFAVLIPVFYAAGYFMLSDAIYFSLDNGHMAVSRIFPSRWLAELYRPAAIVEDAVTSDVVRVEFWPLNQPNS